MKKPLLAALLALAGLAHATDAALWADYKASRDGAKLALAKLEAGNADAAVLAEAQSLYASASTAAAALGRADIVAWQLNNSAYAAILWFKNTTGYTKAVADVEAMKPSPEKVKALAELKAKLKPAFETIAQSAQAKLDEAKVTSTDDSLQAVVKSNRAFLDWVEVFLAK